MNRTEFENFCSDKLLEHRQATNAGIADLAKGIGSAYTTVQKILNGEPCTSMKTAFGILSLTGYEVQVVKRGAKSEEPAPEQDNKAEVEACLHKIRLLEAKVKKLQESAPPPAITTDQIKGIVLDALNEVTTKWNCNGDSVKQMLAICDIVRRRLEAFFN